MSQIATTPGASSPTYPMFSVVGGRAEDQHNMYLARQEQERFQTVAKEAAGLSLDEDAERISEDFVFL